jgi:hypothetical protein
MCTFADPLHPLPPASIAFCFTGGYSQCYNNNNNVQLGKEWVANPHTQQFEHTCDKRRVYISTKCILVSYIISRLVVFRFFNTAVSSTKSYMMRDGKTVFVAGYVKD